MHYLFLILAFTLNATANILLKVGSSKGLLLTGAPLGELIAHNAQTLLGITLFGLNAVFYFLALRDIPLSVGYPIMVVATLLIVNAYAAIALREHISAPQLVGYALIIAGIALVFLFKR